MTNSAVSPRSLWSGRWFFIMATIGSAVGLGNIWKFPYMVGNYGGSAFVLLYLLCMLVLALPLAMSEIMLGRRGRGNPIITYSVLAKESERSTNWKIVGTLGLIGCFLTIAFYSVVGGWVMAYLWDSFSGFANANSHNVQSTFNALLDSPSRLILWHTVFLGLASAIVLCGLEKGIGRANAFMMPALFVILIFLMVYGCLHGDMEKAWRFLFHFDASAITPSVLLAALGHSFFSMSIGFGALMIYGSYLQQEVSIGSSTVVVAIADTLVALLSGLVVFSFVFAGGLEPSSGPGLIMQALPLAFSNIPFNQLVAPLFYVLLAFAAISSAISLLEPLTAWMIETNHGFYRKKASLWVFTLVWLSGIVVALSFNVWSSLHFFGMGLFDTLDAATSRLFMPICGALGAVFIAWFMKKQLVAEEINLSPFWFKVWFFILRYIAPVGVGVIFVHGLFN